MCVFFVFFVLFFVDTCIFYQHVSPIEYLAIKCYYKYKKTRNQTTTKNQQTNTQKQKTKKHATTFFFHLIFRLAR